MKKSTVAEWYRMKRLKAESKRWSTNHRSVLLWLTVPARRDADCSKSLSSVINWPVWWRNVWRVVSLRRGDQRPVRQQHRNNGLVNLDGGYCSHLSDLLRHCPFRQRVRYGEGDVIRQTGNATVTSGQTNVVAPSNCVLDRRHYGQWSP